MEPGIPFHLMGCLCDTGQLVKLREIEDEQSGGMEELYGKITE